MLLWNTNNKMAAPAPVQLQRPVTVSDLVCCVFVYGWPWIDDDGYGYAGCENVYPTRIGAATQVHISFLFYRYMSVTGPDWECRQLTRNIIRPLKLPFEIVFFAYFCPLQRSK